MNRLFYFLASAFCFASVAFAYFYLEQELFMNPCPLCMMQRLAFVLCGFAFLFEAIFWQQKKALLVGKTIRVLSLFFGIGLAARHIYIQNLPSDQVPACGLDFYGLMNKNSLFDGLWQAMQGSGDCATKDLFWGLSLPIWALILFLGLLFFSIIFPSGKSK